MESKTPVRVVRDITPSITFSTPSLMSLFSRLFGKKPQPSLNMWPNHASWAALKNGQTIETEDGPRFMFTTGCGNLALPSGRLIACDQGLKLPDVSRSRFSLLLWAYST